MGLARQPLASAAGSLRASTASLRASIIKAAKGEVDRSKRVGDIDANQNLLIQGIETLRGHHERLLVDGHFVVMNHLGEMAKIEVGVFQKMNPSVIVCLQDDPGIISQRLLGRDGCPPAFDVASLQEAEIAHGESVAQILGVPFYCVRPDDLPEVVKLAAK